MNIESRFTQKAQNSLNYAHDVACKLGHDYVGSEHLLLGLAGEDTSVAAKILIHNNITYDKLLEDIKTQLPIGSPISLENNIALTPRSKRILELSFAEARRLSHGYIGTEHILMAIIRDGESIAVRILLRFGISLQGLYNEIIKALSGDGASQWGSDEGFKGKPNQKTETKTPTLNQFGRDLNEMAKNGKIDPVIGRDAEINRIIQILSRRTKNNPCLIGEPGVGKTAVVEGLAQKIVEGNVPETLKGKRVVTLDLSSMVAGAKYRGEFEERLKKVMEELKSAKNVIIFIDEMHTIIGAGAAEGSIDASNILKPSLARGEIQLIGATTRNEYRKYVEKDAALERRFQPVTVGEPTVEETITILRGIRDKYEAHHSLKITDNALVAAAELSARYISDRFLPDKAIDLVDEASSKVRLKTFTAPPDMKAIENNLETISKEKEQAIATQDFETAANLRDEESKLKVSLESMKGKWSDENHASEIVVTEDDIAEIVSEWTKIPVIKLAEEETTRLLNLEKLLHARVIGQDEAVTSVAKAIRRGRVGLSNPKRPVGSFLFLGPTGVGKTELSKALANAMFGSEDAMIRVDMSEFMEKHAISKLIGSPPGYIGYDDGGQLTEKVRRKPYSVILFDEIEKAHPDVFNILLQILEDGLLTDAQGIKVDFKNTVIIMTSNLGARNITETAKQLGFGTNKANNEKTYEQIKKSVMADLKQTLRPEFLNRIDDIIVFHQLTKNEIGSIARLLMNSTVKRLSANEIRATVTDAAIDYIATEGFDPVYGARPIRRAIQSKLEDMLAEKILDGSIAKGETIVVDLQKENETQKLVVKKA